MIFANDRQVGVEIGPGRGDFLLASAVAQPLWNFFAIEHSHSRTREIEARLAHGAAGNARVVCADASCLLPLIPDASVAAVFTQFPDPWWKRRHHKRRLWTTDFVANLRRVLAPAASIELLTDVEQTFRLAQKYLDAEPGLAAVEVGCLARHDTWFARKALRRGGAIYRSLHRKTAGC